MISLEQLAQKLKGHKASGKKIVLCHGVFDLLHIGHIRYFRQACRFGDVLVVTVTPDRYVDKGPHRPAFQEKLRAEAVASLDCVDYVAINQWSTAEETLRLLQPDFYVKGAEFKEISADMTGKIAREAAVIKEVGAELVFTEDIVFSSSKLINSYMSLFSDEVTEYLALFRLRYSAEKIINIIEDMASLKVMVIGDTILDEYQYCQAMGISSKDPALAVRYQSKDLFAGGVLAVANHVANFVDQVQLVTVLGQEDRQEDFIRCQIAENISPHFITKLNAPTTVKRRFIDGYSFNKLFEVYVMDDSYLSDEVDERVMGWLLENMPKYDLVIAADFGHGAISPKMARILAENAPYLAVNTQANAGNRGFHTIKRYPKTDFACLAEHELRLAMRNDLGHTRSMTDSLARSMGAKQFVTTLGRKGCLAWEGESDLLNIPAFAENVVDRVGAGDAFFAMASLAAVTGVSNEILGFLGSVVAAEAVGIIGNKKPIEKMSVKKHIVSLLK